ncbi:MAG: hypothetical protein HY788_17565 [Deltaproteobacteria bacterium]|nr:hypothetical protein [Deltaproteobacteria bacterium]
MLRKKKIAILLWSLTIVSILLALKTTSDPVLEIFNNTWVESWFQQLPIGNAILFNLSTGFLLSMIFYLLVVWLPYRRTKNLIKQNMIKQWEYFKESSIEILLSACHEDYEVELVEILKDQNEFRKYFKEPANDSRERWYAVCNGLNNELLLNKLLARFELLLDEVRYVCNNVTIEDPDVLTFVQVLSETVYEMRFANAEDADLKSLVCLLWKLFTGWSDMEGYREDDIVAVMIKSI